VLVRKAGTRVPNGKSNENTFGLLRLLRLSERNSLGAPTETDGIVATGAEQLKVVLLAGSTRAFPRTVQRLTGLLFYGRFILYIAHRLICVVEQTAIAIICQIRQGEWHSLPHGNPHYWDASGPRCHMQATVAWDDLGHARRRRNRPHRRTHHCCESIG